MESSGVQLDKLTLAYPKRVALGLSVSLTMPQFFSVRASNPEERAGSVLVCLWYSSYSILFTDHL